MSRPKHLNLLSVSRSERFGCSLAVLAYALAAPAWAGGLVSTPISQPNPIGGSLFATERQFAILAGGGGPAPTTLGETAFGMSGPLAVEVDDLASPDGLVSPLVYDSALDFYNDDQLVSTFAPGILDDPLVREPERTALWLMNLGAFVNDGTITSINGHGVVAALRQSSPRPLNRGAIIATGTALAVSGGAFENLGLIRSTRGTAVATGAVTHSTSPVSTNSGQIEGVTIGLRLAGGSLSNSGTISATNGRGVELEYQTRIENLAGGVIAGATASIGTDYGYSASVLNAGTLDGHVIFGASDHVSTDVFVDLGGTLNGDLRFGAGDDVLISQFSRLRDGRFDWLSGVLDPGLGIDTLVLKLDADTIGDLGPLLGFEARGFELSNNAKLTLTGSSLVTATTTFAGQGRIDLDADIAVSDASGIVVALPYGGLEPPTGGISILSRGAISIVQRADGYTPGVGVALNAASQFENAGVINVTADPGARITARAIQGGDAVVNSGALWLSNAVGVFGAGSLTNSGTIRQVSGGGTALGVQNVSAVSNSGMIEVASQAIQAEGGPFLSVGNSGTIASTGAVAIWVDDATPTMIANAAGGVISAPVEAIHTGQGGDVLRNEGTILGVVTLGGGDDRVENYGAISGRVDLGWGNDTFVQWVGATLADRVDGGVGLDTLTVDSRGGGVISAGKFVNFERFTQIGGGALTYGGAFDVETIIMDGGQARIMADTAVSTRTETTFSGGAAQESIFNSGTITGGVSLGGGADTVVNRGVIEGDVSLGVGDDTYTEGATSRAARIDGGEGSDTYIVELTGDRLGLGARNSFERLGVTGSGVLHLTADQNWDALSLEGAGADLVLNGFTLGAVSGGDGDETLGADRDLASVLMGGGADGVTIGGDRLAGVYDGGLGRDSLSLTATGAVTIIGAVQGFETLTLAGGSLLVAGVLGGAGESLEFGAGDQNLAVLNGGTLAGTIDLGAGSDVLSLMAGGRLLGSVSGGAGDDQALIALSGDLVLNGAQLRQFETLRLTGTGAVSLVSGAARFGTIETSTRDWSVSDGASLETGMLRFDDAGGQVTVSGAFSGQMDLGAGDDRLRLTGALRFAGGAQGGAGEDRLELFAGGTEAAPMALAGAFEGFEVLSLESGVASLSGDYSFNLIDVVQGRLIGLAGSRLSANRIRVAQGATFGSAGTVVGDIAVIGTLSPGASPGVMTVIGNVNFASGSAALFEVTAAASDQLQVSGAVTIAAGAKLSIRGDGVVAPGRRLDLIVAQGGISGAFTTVESALGGNLHLKQSSDRLQLLGLFATDPAFSSQVSDVITYLNGGLISEQASAALVAAAPVLTTLSGASDPAALASLSPQAYASASQIGAENGLSLVEATRQQGFALRETTGVFGFGQALANRRTLEGHAGRGVFAGDLDSFGGIAGLGLGGDVGWVQAFVGYLDGRQSLDGLGARNVSTSFIAGVQGQVSLGALTLNAMVAHDASDVVTRRNLPGGWAARGDYSLSSWVADASIIYAQVLNADWTVRTGVGLSYVSTDRGEASEQGGGPFALNVDSNEARRWFADGQVGLVGGQSTGARLKPHLSVGLRWRIDGEESVAAGAFGGMTTPLIAAGLSRGDVLATAGAGLAYSLTPDLTVSAIYSGEFGQGGRQGGQVGARLRF